MSFSIRARSRSASALGSPPAGAAPQPGSPSRAASESDVLGSLDGAGGGPRARSVSGGMVTLLPPSEDDEAQHSAIQRQIDAATRELDLIEGWLEAHGILQLKMDVTEAFIQAEYPAHDWVQTLREMEEHGELEMFVAACTQKKEQRELAEVAMQMPAELWRLALGHAGLSGADRLAASVVCRVWRQAVLRFTPVRCCLRQATDGERALAWACRSLGDWSLRLQIPQLLLNHGLAKHLEASCSAGGKLSRIDVRAPLSAATGAKLLAIVEHADSSKLEALEMGGSFLGTPGGHGLAACITANRTCSTYNFCANFVGPVAGNAIAASLTKQQCSVTSLDLRRNGLATAAAALGAALAENAVLTTLLLADNELGPDGGAALAVGLRTNSTLTFLDLGKNSLGDDGATAIAEALRESPSTSALRCLDLQANDLGTTTAQAWAVLLSGTQPTRQLRTLILEGNPRLVPPTDAAAAQDTGTAAALAREMAVEELVVAMEGLGGDCLLQRQAPPPAAAARAAAAVAAATTEV